MAYKEIPPFQPNAVMQEFDDFISSVSDSAWYIGKLSWQNNAHRMVGAAGTAGHDGIVTTDGTSTTNSLWLNTQNGLNVVRLGSGVYTCNWVINIQTLSNVTNRYILYVGLGDRNTTEFSDGCYFLYSDNVNSGQWQFKTANGGSRTTQSTSTAVATGWINLGVMVDSTAANVTYYINGAAIGSANTTNIPTNPVSPQFLLVTTAGSAPAMLIDLFYHQHIFTTQR